MASFRTLIKLAKRLRSKTGCPWDRSRTIEDMAESIEEEAQEIQAKRGRDTGAQLLNILKTREIKQFKGFTEEDELYIRNVSSLLEEGALPKPTTKRLLKRLNEQYKTDKNPLKLLSVIKMNIPSEFFKETLAETGAQTSGPREVILSEYLITKHKWAIMPH